MKEALHIRNDIPFYYDKSSTEFRQDSYENYDSVVTRQVMIHLSDKQWGYYPMQQILDYIYNHTPEIKMNILEIGCGVGRVIGEIAKSHPSTICWGIDFSYQMLKKAKETWVDKENSYVNLTRFGLENNPNESYGLQNLHLGLAKCEDLPFDKNSQDFVFSSFLLDRLTDPIKGLQEMKRILKPSGKMVIITPLNFIHGKQWEKFYPPIKIWKILQDIGFHILDWNEEMVVEEPMDIRGNTIKWNCIAFVCTLK